MPEQFLWEPDHSIKRISENANMVWPTLTFKSLHNRRRSWPPKPRTTHCHTALTLHTHSLQHQQFPLKPPKQPQRRTGCETLKSKPVYYTSPGCQRHGLTKSMHIYRRLRNFSRHKFCSTLYKHILSRRKLENRSGSPLRILFSPVPYMRLHK